MNSPGFGKRLFTSAKLTASRDNVSRPDSAPNTASLNGSSSKDWIVMNAAPCHAAGLRFGRSTWRKPRPSRRTAKVFRAEETALLRPSMGPREHRLL
jgi:hypothetical protein